jgi:hypothetical protein
MLVLASFVPSIKMSEYLMQNAAEGVSTPFMLKNYFYPYVIQPFFQLSILSYLMGKLTSKIF